MDEKNRGQKKNRTKIEVMDKKIVNKNWKKDKKKKIQFGKMRKN